MSDGKNTVKGFAVHFKEGGEWGNYIYANFPLPEALRRKFSGLDQPIVWDYKPWPYITKLYCKNCTSKTVAAITDYLIAEGWQQLPQYQLEWNSFSMEDKDDTIYFSCRSTGEYDGIPKDIDGYEPDFEELQMYPSIWGFSVPKQHAAAVRDVLLSRGWHE